MAAAHATLLIQDGDWIRIDGAQGIVAMDVEEPGTALAGTVGGA